MKAIEFVQKFGWEEASEIVAGVPSKYMECYYSTLHWCNRNKKYSDRFKPRIDLVNIADLKRLVESYELIERLGGYEKIRPHLILTDSHAGYTHIRLHSNGHYCFLDDQVDYIIPDKAISIKLVMAALLEYRRANNIFEAGDNFCYADKYSKDDDLDGVAYSSLHTIDDLDFQSGWANEVISRNIIRHATDEEIEAGERLESLKEMT